MLRAAVPEAAVNKHGHMSTGEHDIGSTALGQVPVEPEPRACRMKCLTKANLRRGALLTTTREVPAFGGAHPLLGHPVRLAREGYCLLPHELLLERVSGWGQHAGAWIQVRTQDR